jgi:hypothetical protein
MKLKQFKEMINSVPSDYDDVEIVADTEGAAYTCHFVPITGVYKAFAFNSTEGINAIFLALDNAPKRHYHDPNPLPIDDIDLEVKAIDKPHSEPPLVIFHKGEPIFALNRAFIKAQKAEENTPLLIEAYELKASLFCELAESRDYNEIRRIAHELSDLEFIIQDLYNFPMDESFHRFWALPLCKCAKVDNRDAWGTGYYTHSASCPLHGYQKIVSASSLALRFYAKDGWTLEELESLTEKNNGFHYWEKDFEPYYIANPGTVFDVEALASVTSEIKKAFDDKPNETIEECIKRFNW